MDITKINTRINIPVKYLIAVAVAYIYIPIAIFLIGFTRIYIALPVLVCTMFCIWRFINNIENELISLPVLPLLFCFLALFIWLLICGNGGYFPQCTDWKKHNAILHDLTEKSWPVYYVNHDEKSMLSYYIAQYIVPALVGKICGHSFAISEFALMIWNYAGIVLLFAFVCCLLKTDTWKKMISLCAIIIFFCGILYLADIVCYYLYGDMLTSHLSREWLGGDGFIIQYRSNATFIRYAFPQWIVPALITSLFYKFRQKIEDYVILLMPVMLYSSISFLIVVIIAVMYVLTTFIISNKKKEVLYKVLSVSNLLCAVSLGGILILYLYGNILGEKPDSIGFTIQDFSSMPLAYPVFCIFMFGLHYILIAGKYKKDILFWISLIILLILPFFCMGKYNDLNLAGTVMPLFLLQIYIANYLLNIPGKNISKYILIILLLLGAVYPTINIAEHVVHNTPGKQTEDKFQTMEKFADRSNEKVSDDKKYNYFAYDIENNIFYKYAARTKILDKE